MRVGIECSGIGPTASASFVANAARLAERVGFASFWTGEHVLLFDRYPESKYPYAGDYGTDVPIPDPKTAMLDPVIAMTWAAAATSRIEIGSAILILPQRNPVILAKELASLDALSGGRVALGVGVGWCKEEYEAVGADWPGRGARTDEHLQAMRALWRDDVSTFHGQTVAFERAYLYPKPVRGDIPVLIGGESDLALKRAAKFGDGWIAFKLTPEEAPGRIAKLQALAADAGRDTGALRIITAIFSNTSLDDMKRYRDAGVTEFNLVTAGELPTDEAGLAGMLQDWAERIVQPAAQL